jgi:hypothetical protein
MKGARWIVALGVIGITALSFLVYPGCTYLQSDTQIYVPILERLYNPALFANDPMATDPHVSFTILDEVSIAVRKATGLGFREILLDSRRSRGPRASWACFSSPRRWDSRAALAPGSRPIRAGHLDLRPHCDEREWKPSRAGLPSLSSCWAWAWGERRISPQASQ